MKRLLPLLLIITLVSCQKAQRDEDTAVNTCVDISLAQTIFADAYKQVRIAALNTKSISGAETTLTTIYGCEEISVDSLASPASMIIDYKYIGCEGLGVARYGRLLADFFGPFGIEGSAIDIVFSNYFYQEYEVNGKIRVIFKARNTEDKEVHTFYLQGGTIDDGNAVLSWTSSQTWTIDSPKNKAEIYSIRGNSNGTNRKGNTFRSDVLSDNIMSDDCLYVKSGTMKVEVKNLSDRTLNYGTGSCDRSAEVNINGAVYQMNIP